MKSLATTILCLLLLTFNPHARAQEEHIIKLNFIDQDTTIKDTSGERYLTTGSSISCGWIDSVNQLYEMQFVNTDLPGWHSNCSYGGCASTKWKFNTDSLKNSMSISNTQGCPSDGILAGSYSKGWYWKYDNVGRVVKLFGEDGLVKYELLISSIDRYSLDIIIFKNDE